MTQGRFHAWRTRRKWDRLRNRYHELHNVRWGPEIGIGWFPIIEQLLKDLRSIGATPVLTQIKEKFGGLRVYWTPFGHEIPTPSIETVIRVAEERARKTCDRCGRPGYLAERKGWWATRCDKHHPPA
jgi:hypothetical protein